MIEDGYITITIPLWLWWVFLGTFAIDAILKIRVAYWKRRLRIAQEERAKLDLEWRPEDALDPAEVAWHEEQVRKETGDMT